MKPVRLRSGSDLEVVSEILVRIMYLIERFANRCNDAILFFQWQFLLTWKVNE